MTLYFGDGLHRLCLLPNPNDFSTIYVWIKLLEILKVLFLKVDSTYCVPLKNTIHKLTSGRANGMLFLVRFKTRFERELYLTFWLWISPKVIYKVIFLKVYTNSLTKFFFKNGVRVLFSALRCTRIYCDLSSLKVQFVPKSFFPL